MGRTSQLAVTPTLFTHHIVRTLDANLIHVVLSNCGRNLASLQGHGYPAFVVPPPLQAPFIPPPPFNRPQTEPTPPVFVPSAAQNPQVSFASSPPVIPGSARRPPATPHPSAHIEPLTQPQPQRQRQSQPPPSTSFRNQDLSRVLDPLGPASLGVFGPPGPRPRTPISNPLPPPPRDVYDSSPYRSLLNLPQTTALLTSTYGTVVPPPERASTTRKKSRKGLFHSLSSRRKREETPMSFVPAIVTQPQPNVTQPNPNAATNTATTTTSTAATAAVIPQPEAAPPTVPPIRFDHQGPLAGFMNHSQHRVLYQNKTYPSALHLHEALKFLDHRPDLSEQIRNCPHVHEVYPLSATLQEFVRSDWGQVFLKMVCPKFSSRLVHVLS